MEPSKPPKDVLGLGRHLERELGFEEQRNTLGRWMAHHLAELIDRAENGATESERLEARNNATETILKIWEKREVLPGKAFPLTPYKDVLTTLELLLPDRNPWSRRSNEKREQLAAILFEGIARLSFGILFLKSPPISEDSSAGDNVAYGALSETEQRLVETLLKWFEILASTDERSGRVRKAKRVGRPKKVNVNKAVLRLIDEIMTTLAELRRDLEEDSTSPKKASNDDKGEVHA